MVKSIFGDRGIALLAVGETLVWAGFLYIFPALLLRWEDDLGWSRTQITGAITLALLCSAVWSPFVGRFIDRGHGPFIMACSAIVGAVTLFLLSNIHSVWQFYLLWAVIGSAMAGCLYEPCFALITRAYRDQARHSILIVTLVAGFAGTISFPSAHALADLYGWRVAVRCFALVVLCVGVPALWFGARLTESRVVAGAKTSHIELAKIPALLTRSFLCLAIAFSILAVVHGVTIHHLLYILADQGLGAAASVFVASLIGPMQVAGRLFMLAFDSRLGNYEITGISFFSLAISLVVLMLVVQLHILAFVFVFLFGTGYGIVSVVRPAVARDVLGEADFGLKSGLLALFFLIGSAIAPYFGAVLWTFGGYNLVLMVMIGMAVTGFWLFRKVYIVTVFR